MDPKEPVLCPVIHATSRELDCIHPLLRMPGSVGALGASPEGEDGRVRTMMAHPEDCSCSGEDETCSQVPAASQTLSQDAKGGRLFKEGPRGGRVAG